jgi:TRAP-type C4-dicarboxylate transport system permease small subunit
MGRALDKLLMTLNVFSGLVVIFVTLSVALEVITRYFLGHPNSWVVDLSEYSLVFILFLSVGWTLWKGGHVEITTVTERLPEKIRGVLKIVATAIGLIVCVSLLWHSVVLTVKVYKAGDLFFKALVIPKWPVFTIIPVGFFTLVLEYMRRLVFLCRGKSRQG